jgi:hypothetical protein
LFRHATQQREQKQRFQKRSAQKKAEEEASDEELETLPEDLFEKAKMEYLLFNN